MSYDVERVEDGFDIHEQEEQKTLISEVFYSIQCEGPNTGKPSIFIRFFGCNLRCKFKGECCDTPYAVLTEHSNAKLYNIEELVKEVKKYPNATNIVFTGGEPMLAKNIISMKRIISEMPWQNFEIETNGTLELSEEDEEFLYEYSNRHNLIFNISPKINFPQLGKQNTNPILLHQLNDSGIGPFIYIVKFLFNDDKDLDLIHDKIEEWGISTENVYVQPIGIDSNMLRSKINTYWKRIMEEGWNISLRSHVFLFENERGI